MAALLLLLSSCTGRVTAEPDEAAVAAAIRAYSASGGSGNDPITERFDTTVDPSWLGMSLTLPQNSAEPDNALARQLIVLGGEASASACASYYETLGFTVLEQRYFDQTGQDITQTCAYTIGRGTVTRGGIETQAYLITLRPTAGVKWFANFNISPSRTDTSFVQEFLLPANDVFLRAKELIGEEHPVIIVTGFSRGASCANVLGFLLDAAYGSDDLYVYTFASPRTVTAEVAAQFPCPSIFNYVNSADPVAMIPPAGWGLARFGTDILLQGSSSIRLLGAALRERLADLVAICPDVYSFYHKRFSLTGPGESESGVTLFEIIMFVGGQAFSEPGESFLGDETDLSSLLGLIAKGSDLRAAQGLIVLVGASDNAVRIGTQHQPKTYQEMLAGLDGTETE
ncbi:MAG: hypothetical protein IJR83_05350 [Clostridia bacterium]|nr:hypothetical protein [Clostridia bacterium]